MTLLQSILLGIVQGLTEFLPVSSKGHLALFQHFIPDFSQPGVLFDVVLHLGTVLAVLIYFRERVLAVLKDLRLLGLLLAATIPVGILGILFQKKIEHAFTDMKLTAACFIITGFILYFADRLKEGVKTEKTLYFGDALKIGLIQCLALLPGLSRSGTTISGGIFSGLSRKSAMEFSFLLSIPAILGAALVECRHLNREELAGVNPLIYFAGLVTAAVVGYLAIKGLLNILQKHKLYYFSIYLFILGTAILVFL